MLNQIRIDAFDEFVNQLSTESHRAAVILSVAKLDQQLYFLLSRHLLPSYKQEDELFNGDSPLSTLSAKISVCYRLGLIDSDFAKALHLIRKIRNDFAHEINTRLDKPPNRERIRTLINIVKGTDLFKDVKEVYFQDSNGIITEFFTALTLFAVRLESLLDTVIQIDSGKAASISPSNYPKSGKQKGDMKR